MSVNFKFVQALPAQLYGSGSAINDNQIILVSFTDPAGNALSMSDFGVKGYGTMEPNNGLQQESFSFTGLTVNGNGSVTLTGVKTVLFKYPYTETLGLRLSHAGGTSVIISNTPDFYSQIATLNSDASITGTWTFSSSYFPQIDNGLIFPTLSAHFATKGYVDSVAISGGANASSTVKGISKLTSDPSVPTNPIALNGEEVSSTSGANKVVRAGAGGKIDQGYIDLTAAFTFSGTTNLNGTTTFANSPSITTPALTANKVVSLDASAKLPAVDGSGLTNLPNNYFSVGGPMSSNFPSFSLSQTQASFDPTGSYMYYMTTVTSGANVYIWRFTKDATTGAYYYDGNTVTLTAGVDYQNSGYNFGITAGTNYAWFTGLNAAGNNIGILRFAKDLTGKQTMTISGTANTYTYNVACGDDNTIYVPTIGGNKLTSYSISGTTATRGSDITLTAADITGATGLYTDGSYFYYNYSSNQIFKYPIAGGAAVSSPTIKFVIGDTATFAGGSMIGLGFNRTGVIWAVSHKALYQSTNIKSMVLEGRAITKF